MNGHFVKSIDLKEACKQDPKYPCGITADRHGGVVVEDFRTGIALLCISRDGSLRNEITSFKMPNGVAADLRGFLVSPDGRLWGCDGTSIMRITEHGVVDRVLGRSPDTAELQSVADIMIDFNDRVYAVDDRTGSVHVFSPGGKRIQVCQPEPGDFSGRMMSADLTVTDTGDVFVAGDRLRALEGDATKPPGTHLHFSSDGRRLGWSRFEVDSVSQELYAQPNARRFWIVGYHDLFLVDEAGTVIRTIGWRADGKWLVEPGEACVAADGSIAVVAASDYTHRSREMEQSVSAYSASGDPLVTFELPLGIYRFTHVAYDGARFVLAGEHELFLFDKSGRPIMRFNCRQAGFTDAPGRFFFARGGRELWVPGSEWETVHRFELP